MEPIAADEMVIEYVGQIIRQVKLTQTGQKKRFRDKFRIQAPHQTNAAQVLSNKALFPWLLLWVVPLGLSGSSQ